MAAPLVFFLCGKRNHLPPEQQSSANEKRQRTPRRSHSQQCGLALCITLCHTCIWNGGFCVFNMMGHRTSRQFGNWAEIALGCTLRNSCFLFNMLGQNARAFCRWMQRKRVPTCHRKQQILVIRNRRQDADSGFAVWSLQCHTSCQWWAEPSLFPPSVARGPQAEAGEQDMVRFVPPFPHPRPK